MVEFLTTRGTSSQIEDIINNAKNRITLISAYVKIPDTLFQNLKVADRKKVEIRLVYGKRELNPDVKNQLKQLNNLSLHFLKELHAKCFFNEECMVITSMNLYDFSEINNKEMGVLVTVKDDPDVFEKAREEADRIIDSAEEVKLRRSALQGVAKMLKSIPDAMIKDEPSRPKISSYSHRTSSRQKGFCIRCRKEVPYKLKAPYCLNCYKVWKERKDSYQEEPYCHACGERKHVTFAMPRCKDCYNASKRQK